jgi:hypothetical protein
VPPITVKLTSRSRLVFVVGGRHRLMLRLSLDPFRYRWALRHPAPGTLSGGFGFGMFSYLRTFKDQE